MKQYFVTIGVAKVLMANGFNEKCMAFYNAHGALVRYANFDMDPHDIDTQVLTNTKIKVPQTYCAPLWIQAYNWYNEVSATQISMNNFFIFILDDEEIDYLFNNLVTKEANRIACKWYENQDADKRHALQDEFGNKGVPDHEVKFYSWLVQNRERLNIVI